MKSILTLLFVCSGLFGSSIIFANPVVTNNVHVMQNANPSQCTSSWNGRGGTETSVADSGIGQNNIATPSIQSCTGCAIDPQSHDCVCSTCYSYTN